MSRHVGWFGLIVVASGCSVLVDYSDVPEPVAAATTGAGGMATVAATVGVGGMAAVGGMTGQGGAAAVDCWHMKPDGWTVGDVTNELAMLAGAGNKAFPVLSADGLSLHYLLQDLAGDTAVYRAEREGRSELFTGGLQVTPTFVGLYGRLAILPGVELYLSKTVPPFAIYRSSYKEGSYGKLGADPVLSEGSLDAMAANGLSLTLHRDVAATGFAIFEARRTSIDDPFDVQLVDYPTTYPDTEQTICAVLSADGLHMVFGGTGAADVSMGNLPDNAVQVYQIERSTLTQPWTERSHYTSLADMSPMQTGPYACPTAVTADGCELRYHRFGVGGGATQYVAIRSP